MDKMRKLFESVDACADRLEALNSQFADLASDSTRQSVEAWRNLKESVIFDHNESRKESGEGVAIKAIAIDLLERQGHGLEDVIDLLMSDHNIEIDIKSLAQTIGKQAYIAALRRDAADLLDNSISYNQIASLWNDLDRPAFGSENWTGRSVSILVE